MMQRGVQLWLKIAFDRIVGTVGFVLLLPVMAVTALMIRVTMGSPVLFRQSRPGFRERLFVIYKFRTMLNARDAEGRLLPDEKRITRIGSIIRAMSLDELPQLWNVMRGELSLVGPRPLLIEYLDRYSPQQRSRHDVRPGITGWAQINGRNAIEWNEKFDLDLWYVRNWSFWLDLQIIGRTIAGLFRSDDINHPGHVSMPEFRGEEQNRRDVRP